MAKNASDAWLLGPDAPAAEAKKGFNVSLSRGKVKLRDVSWVLDKLATTQNAGVAIFRSLGRLAEMRAKDPISGVLRDIQHQMSEGGTFEGAVRSHEKTFGPLVCALIEAGAAEGSLEQAIRRASELTEARVRLRRKIRGALIYPISVVVITTALIAALLLFVVPRFEEIYSSVGSDLPALTKVLVVLSSYAPVFTGILAVLVLAGYFIVRRSKTDVNIRRRLDAFKLRVPLIGSLIRKGVNARIASTLSSLLGAGVPLLQALDYAGSSADNIVYSDALKSVRQKVTEGMYLSEAFDTAEKGLFPPLLIELSAVGEETGSLGELMDKYANDAEEEVANTADALTRIIEPLMMVVIGGVVGVFLVGLYLPIIQIGNQIQ